MFRISGAELLSAAALFYHFLCLMLSCGLSLPSETLFVISQLGSGGEWMNIGETAKTTGGNEERRRWKTKLRDSRRQAVVLLMSLIAGNEKDFIYKYKYALCMCGWYTDTTSQPEWPLLTPWEMQVLEAWMGGIWFFLFEIWVIYDLQKNTEEKYILDLGNAVATHYFQYNRRIFIMANQAWLGWPLPTVCLFCLSGPTFHLTLIYHPPLAHLPQQFSPFFLLLVHSYWSFKIQTTLLQGSQSWSPGLGQIPPHRFSELCVLLFHSICPRCSFVYMCMIILLMLPCPTWSRLPCKQEQCLILLTILPSMSTNE